MSQPIVVVDKYSMIQKLMSKLVLDNIETILAN